MSTLNESCTSFLTAALPTSTAAKIILVASTITCTAYIIRVTSPAHLTRMIVSALTTVEHSYMQVIESGTFIGEYAVLTERLASLQLSVSLLREAALHDSRSYWAPFSQFLRLRCTLAILRCFQDVRDLQTDIEILQEIQLRELPLGAATTAATRTISMRCRLELPTSSPGAKSYR